MRRVLVSEFMSLDGVIKDPGGSGELDRGGWSFRSERGAEGDKFKDDELVEADKRRDRRNRGAASPLQATRSR